MSVSLTYAGCMFRYHNEVDVELPLAQAIKAVRAYGKSNAHTYEYVEDPPGTFTAERRTDRPKLSGHAKVVMTLVPLTDAKTQLMIDAQLTGPMGMRLLRLPVSHMLRESDRRLAQVLPGWYEYQLERGGSDQVE